MAHQTGGEFRLKLISHEALARYMKYRDFTVRSLAEAVQKELVRKKADPRITCSRAKIGHLRSGYSDVCDYDEVAMAIEEVLGAPRGSLFVPSVSRVSQVVSRTRVPA
jgi:hypothetical protein